MQLSRNISGQNFIVTGAARGIGLAISTLFSNLGARVSGWDIDADDMRDNSVFADTQVVDVTDEKATIAGFDSSLQRLGVLMELLLMLALTDRPNQCGSIRWQNGMLSWL